MLNIIIEYYHYTDLKSILIGGVLLKEILGYFLIAQAILTGIIVYSLQQLGDSIKASAAYVATKEGDIGWGGDFSLIILILLILIIGMGFFLIVKRK